MPNDELFSGIPSLEDEAGLENYLNNAALTEMGAGSGTIPPALQTQTPAPQTQQPQTQPQDPNAPAQPNVPQYTSEQIAQIIARNQQLEAMAQQRPVQSAQPNTAYTPKQAAIIKQLIDRGVPLERISQALNGQRQNNQVQDALAQRLSDVEKYLQHQQYISEQNAFIDKMTVFGNKFGLSEADLVTFGNKAMSMGINLTTVNDVEAVFRAVYPDQYAIRSQRMSGAPSSQIYGGSNTPETPRAASSKLEDAYVEQFLKSSMPNQYGMNTK